MIRPVPRVAGLLAFVGIALALHVGAAPAAGADPLREKILDSKYSRGDYAIYLGWHDPEAWQFDEHGTYAFPVGVKVRLRALGWLRFETDIQYYRRSSDTSLRLSVFRQPEFDCFSTGLAAQWVPLRSTPFVPYIGGGVVFVSLGNDFVAFRPDVWEQQPGNPDQFVLASWGEWDLGWQAMAGLEFPTGRRAFPFVEFRYLFGTVEFEARDVRLGSLSVGGIGLEISDLETVPDDLGNLAAGGRPHEGRFDWSGPVITLGLKIRF